jgi:hypothetical protein
MISKGNVTIEKRTLDEFALVICGRRRMKKRKIGTKMPVPEPIGEAP